MHTIKNKQENQIIHYNPDLSGNINIICKGKNNELTNDLEIEGQLLKDLFLENKTQIFNCETCKNLQKENMFCTAIYKNVTLDFGCFYYR